MIDNGAETTQRGASPADVEAARHGQSISALTGWSQATEIALIRTASLSLYARLRSIEWDARHLLRLHDAIAPRLPLFGNVRAGAWYVPSSPAHCCFKSADGHYCQWQVSPRRPNIALLRAAARAGGAVVADVTRAGKSWPDALSKTLPMWCAIVSAVAAGVGREEEQHMLDMLHLHPSVPESERAAIRRRLPDFLRLWIDSGVDLRKVAPECFGADGQAVQVRPLWVRADAELLWENGVPSAEVLGYVPIICVSASPPVPPGERAFKEADPVGDVCGEIESVGGVSFPHRDVGFSYVQGAGDDQEAWCQGLTPEVFWKNRDELLEFARGRQNAVVSESNLREEMASLLRKVMCREEALAVNSKLLSGLSLEKSTGELTSVLTMCRVAVEPSQTGRIIQDVEAAADRRVSPSTPVIVLSYGEHERFGGEDEGATWLRQAQKSDVFWFNMADRRGKPDFKHALSGVLERCLSVIRESSIASSDCSERAANDVPLATIICDSGDGDWATAIAVAWMAWHCAADTEGDYAVMLEPSRQKINKADIRQLLLRVATERSDLVVSRRSIQQLNTFFFYLKAGS